jgi:hypothetical protein
VRRETCQNCNCVIAEISPCNNCVDLVLHY